MKFLLISFLITVTTNINAQKVQTLITERTIDSNCILFPYSSHFKIDGPYYNCGSYARGMFHVIVNKDKSESLIIREDTRECDNKNDTLYANGDFKKLSLSKIDHSMYKVDKEFDFKIYTTADMKTRGYLAKYDSEVDSKYIAIKYLNFKKEFKFFGIFSSPQEALDSMNEVFSRFL